MSFSQGWPITANNRVALVDFASSVAPYARRGGFTFDASGALVYASAGGTAPDAVVAGFPFDANGSLKINNGSGAPATFTELHGFRFSAGVTQAITVSDSDAIANYQNGLPFAAGGRLCIEFAAPSGFSAFSDGFDEGFA